MPIHSPGSPTPGVGSRASARVRCFAAVHGSVLRISSHLHVTDRDIDRLIDALGTAVAG